MEGERPVRHKLLTYGVLAFVLFYVITNPSAAAATAGRLGTGLARAAGAVGDFLAAVTGGAP
jgi:hypothetical protein